MIDAAVVGATVTGRGLIVWVRCHWCGRVHHHFLRGGHDDYQPPSCGTPSRYAISVSAIERPTITTEERE